VLGLSSNQISDISPLASLTNLTVLGLHENQISDISPLVANSGLSSGDVVYLEDNPLDTDSLNTYIPQLKNRGVEVFY
jgi:Leucine-rich repeat (LRR) protein